MEGGTGNREQWKRITIKAVQHDKTSQSQPFLKGTLRKNIQELKWFQLDWLYHMSVLTICHSRVW